MNLKLNKQPISVYKNRKIENTKADRSSTPLSRNYGNNISFRGDAVDQFSRTVDKVRREISYSNVEKVIRNIDQTLGSDGFFLKVLKKAGLISYDKAGNPIIPNNISLKDDTLFTDLFNTIAFPVLELPVRAVNAVLGAFGKEPIVTKHLQSVEKSANYKLCRDILDRFTSLTNNEKVLNYLDNFSDQKDKIAIFTRSYDLDECTEHFKDFVAYDVGKLYKGYKTRDERTLNRMATSTVSALYSANDFYNISMLQKDDKDEAKKAHHSRFKQEMTRMMLSAGMTFLTLGALDRIVKRNIIINAVVIAMSSLISEVGSRIFSKTPLHPLTPEQAKKIAQRRKAQNAKQNGEVKQNSASNSNTDNNTKSVQFKGEHNNQKNLFIQFASKDGSFAPMNSLMKSAANEAVPKTKAKKKSKINLSQVLGLATIACSGFYIANKALKGKFYIMSAKKKLYEKPGIKKAIVEYLSGNGVYPEQVEKELSDIASELKKRRKSLPPSLNLKNKFLKYKVSFSAAELKDKVSELAKRNEKNEIKPILNEFLENIDKLIINADEPISTRVPGVVKNGSDVIIEYKKDVPALPGLYNGFTKVFKTVYQILSAPGMLCELALKKTVFKESEMAFDALDAYRKKFSCYDIKDELVALNELVSKKGWSDAKKLDYIKKNTRTFESSAETGELANLSRTMVTAISTYFFVNDYTNKVLIESEGRDVEAAKEERNERLAHKVSNFVINGTLMNVFNSVFKFPLNRSLAEATLIAAATETTNEFFVRKSICQPFRKMKSKQDVIDYEKKQMDKKGLMGWWSRTFKKLTGKKSLTQKVGVSVENTKKDK